MYIKGEPMHFIDAFLKTSRSGFRVQSPALNNEGKLSNVTLHEDPKAYKLIRKRKSSFEGLVVVTLRFLQIPAQRIKRGRNWTEIDILESRP